MAVNSIGQGILRICVPVGMDELLLAPFAALHIIKEWKFRKVHGSSALLLNQAHDGKDQGIYCTVRRWMSHGDASICQRQPAIGDYIYIYC